jgi:site-specific recombinase XerD
MESLSKDELIALLAAAKAKRTRDWLMILVAYSHGLRASEVVGGWCTKTVNGKKVRYLHPGILVDDLDDGHLSVHRLKGSLHTVQPLVGDLNPLLDERQALLDYSNKMLGNQKLFPLTRQRFWQLMREHGRTARIPIRKLFPHVLKRTIAMQSIHSAGIENVRQYLGHKSMASTGEYLKVSDADASAAIGKALRE